MKTSILPLVLIPMSGLAGTWDYAVMRDFGQVTLEAVPTDETSPSLPVFVAAQVDGRWFFKTDAGWEEWNGELDSVKPYLSARHRFVLESGFDPDKLPPFEVYLGEGNTLREVVETGNYQLLFQSSWLPPHPVFIFKECLSTMPCRAFRVPVELKKIRFIDLNTGAVEEDAGKVMITGFFNGNWLVATDTGGCTYSGPFRQVVLSLYKAVDIERGGTGVKVEKCQDPERIGIYNNFNLSLEEDRTQVFFSYSTIGSVFRPGYMLLGTTVE